MAYQSKPPSGQPFEQKPGTGSAFTNEDYDINGDPDDTNNYAFNGKYTEFSGDKVNFRFYRKVAKSGIVWYKMSSWKTDSADQQGQQHSQPVQQAPVQQPPVQQQGKGEKMPWDD